MVDSYSKLLQLPPPPPWVGVRTGENGGCVSLLDYHLESLEVFEAVSSKHRIFAGE